MKEDSNLPYKFQLKLCITSGESWKTVSIKICLANWYISLILIYISLWDIFSRKAGLKLNIEPEFWIAI